MNPKRVLLRITAIVFFSLGYQTTVAHASTSIVGGYSAASRTDQGVVNAANFAVNARQDAMNAKQKGGQTKLGLVKVLSAESQVVAGTNYRLRLSVKVNGKEQKVEAVVWWQAWRKPNPYELTAWEAK